MTIYRDFANNVRVWDAGDPVDLQEADSVLFVSTGAITVSESDETTGFAEVDSADLIVPEGGEEQEGAFVVGYSGDLRYVTAAGAGEADVIAVTYHQHRAPVGYDVESRTQD